MTNNKLTEFEGLFREKLNGLDYPYDPTGWEQLEKDIARGGGTSGFWAKMAIVGALLIALTFGALYLFDKNSSDFSGDQSGLSGISDNDIIRVVNNKSTDNSHNDNSVTNQSIGNTIDDPKIHEELTDPVWNQQTNPLVSQNTNYSQSDPTVNNFKHDLPNAEFSYSQYEGCGPVTVKFKPVENCDTMIYSWDFGDGTYSTEKTPEHSYTKPGKYSVRLTVKYFQSSDLVDRVRNQLVYVWPKPEASFNWTVDEYEVSLSCETEGISRYSWYTKDTLATEASVDLMFAKNGTYPVKLIVWNSYGCSDTLIQNVSIDVSFPFYMPDAFNPEGVTKYFGPATQGDYIFEMMVYNSRGQCVYKGKGASIAWDGNVMGTLQPAEAGKYVYKLKAVDGQGRAREKDGTVELFRK